MSRGDRGRPGVRLAAAFAFLVLLAPWAAAQLRGHGGPVRALAVSTDGDTVLSGGFDQSAIVWRVDRGIATAVLRFHDGAVNAVALLRNGEFATGGEDGKIAIWRPGRNTPSQVFADHQGPIAGLAVSPRGDELGSAAWDGTASLRRLAPEGERRVLAGHQGNVNGVAFLPDGRLVSASYDATLRIWPRSEGAAVIVTLPAPLNAVAAAPDSEIVAAGADGRLYVVTPDGARRGTIELEAGPVTSLAISPDGARIAAGTIGNGVAIVARAERKVLQRVGAIGWPVWAVAFRAKGKELLTGGGDGAIRRWDAETGAPIGQTPAADTAKLAEAKDDRGAEVFQACAACHSLTANGGNRAGPSLHGLFGRRIATAPGYNFSEALKTLDIVWNAVTVSTLFEIGPSRYTPGTKMPEQVISDAGDRAALVKFLEGATKPR